MKTFLSIDWDYFVDATYAERYMLFPDGGNEKISGALSDYIWATLYAQSRVRKEAKPNMREIAEIGLIQKEYDFMKNILKNIATHCCSMCSDDSHAKAHDVFLGLLDAGETCNIINIDYHHDMYKNQEGTVDCGNWLSELYRSGKVKKITWVARTDSDDLPDEYLDCENIVKTTDLFETCKQLDTVDGVFICRSGIWSPPHLDTAFIQLFKSLMDVSKRYTVQKYNRYTNEFKKSVRENVKVEKVSMQWLNMNK